LSWFLYSKKLNSGTLQICFNIGQVEESLKNIFLPFSWFIAVNWRQICWCS